MAYGLFIYRLEIRADTQIGKQSEKRGGLRRAAFTLVGCSRYGGQNEVKGSGAGLSWLREDSVQGEPRKGPLLSHFNPSLRAKYSRADQ